MWVSKDEWEKLNKRLADIESRLSWETMERTITIPVSGVHYQLPRVSVKEAIALIMAHLGLKFAHKAGAPAHTEVEKTA